MGIDCGPAPTDEAWERFRNEIQAVMDEAKAQGKTIAFPVFGPATVASKVIEMS